MTAKSKTPKRWYTSAKVRAMVLQISDATGLSPNDVIEGSLAIVLNVNARTGQPLSALGKTFHNAVRELRRRSEREGRNDGSS